MPVPASRTTTTPSPRSTSTHDVLPPYRTVCGPGDASEPRHPQMRMRKASASVPGGELPEDGHRPDELVAVREERDAGHRDRARHAVEAREAHDARRRPPLDESDPGGHLLEAHRRAVGRLG